MLPLHSVFFLSIGQNNINWIVGTREKVSFVSPSTKTYGALRLSWKQNPLYFIIYLFYVEIYSILFEVKLYFLFYTERFKSKNQQQRTACRKHFEPSTYKYLATCGMSFGTVYRYPHSTPIQKGWDFSTKQLHNLEHSASQIIAVKQRSARVSPHRVICASTDKDIQL